MLHFSLRLEAYLFTLDPIPNWRGTMHRYKDKALKVHREAKGKIEIHSKVPVETLDDLSIAYTPGVAAPCLAIAEDPTLAKEMTVKANSVAVVTDGSAVLGLGNIGPEAALPVMEGKALLFKRYGGVDAWPICLDTQDVDEIVQAVRMIAPGFGGINLEDISAPRCFEVELRLQDLGIPVFHDDQNGTGIAVLAALINSAKVLDRKLTDMKVVISGAGAAGIAIAKLLAGVGIGGRRYSGDIVMCDSKGIISSRREDLTHIKRRALRWTNADDISGSMQDALHGADIFIGVSQPDLLSADDVRTMNKDSIILAMSNPNPEIRPEEAKAGGAAIVATGRSDYPNQVNNVLVFPGLFRGILDAGAKHISPRMLVAAAHALADIVENPTPECIIPNIIDPKVDVAGAVSSAVYDVAVGVDRNQDNEYAAGA